MVLSSRTAFYRSFDRVECRKREKEWEREKKKHEGSEGEERKKNATHEILLINTLENEWTVGI